MKYKRTMLNGPHKTIEEFEFDCVEEYAEMLILEAELFQGLNKRLLEEEEVIH